ncbi:Rha family transcriptional regulator [Paeniclostridium hominis]|nr:MULTISPECIES: Rha family transcriptional regulator [Paeniclostridium]
MKRDLQVQGTNNEEMRISTREIADMLKTTHDMVLRKLDGRKDRRGIIAILTDNQMVVSDYFIESTYVDASGKTNREYLVSKMGCDFLANKFQGEKGMIFTAKYVKKFHTMQNTLKEVRVESYMIEDPIARAQAWIREQQEKKEVELKLIHTSKILDEVVNNNITFDAFNKELSKIINTISRHVGTDSGYIYGSFYSFINNKLGINLTTRQTHKKRKLNEEYFARTGRYYKDSTLKTKVSKLSCIKVSEYEQVLEVAKSFAVDNGVDITNYNKLTIKTA